MARCCGGGCSCKVEAGSNITVTGVGTAASPFVISTNVALTVTDTDVVNLTLTGAGTAASPWALSAAFASTAQLGDLPDVNAPSPTNAQVLGWDTATSKWTPRAPTTAASGSVQHDTSLSGDGSAGTPLQVLEDPNGGLTTAAAGLGLTTTYKNQLVRRFTNSTARTAASPAPTTNTISVLDTVPGQLDYYTGSAWAPIKGAVSVDATGQQMLSLSGAYAAGAAVTVMVRNFSGTTDANGQLTILSNALISGRAGVLSASVTPTGEQAYVPTLNPGSNFVYMVARRVDDGAVLANQAVTGQVTAYVY